MQIRKIAPPAAGNQNLPPHLSVMFQQSNSPPAQPGTRGTHQSRRPSTQNNHIELARRSCHRSCKE